MDIKYLLFQGYPNWLRGLAIVWVLFGAVLLAIRIWIPPTTPDAQISEASPANPVPPVIQEMKDSPDGVQIGGNVGSFTLNKNMGRADDETLTRLVSEIKKRAQFRNVVPDSYKPPTLTETLYTDKFPGLLFTTLLGYDERDILKIPKVGDALNHYMDTYSNFQNNTASLEREVLPRIGQLVETKFPAGWTLCLQYVILRFYGRTKESIIAGGNFLNYGITWEDAERVFVVLSADPSINQAFTEQIKLYEKTSDTANKIAADLKG